jgi:hypothetical protein
VKSIIYVAHPVTGDVKANCDKVLQWLKWLTKVDPSRIYIAPWVGEVLAHLDQDPIPADFYDRVLSDDEEVVARLDGILLTGIGTNGPYLRPNGFMRSSGMTREVAASVLSGGTVYDMRHFATAEEAAADLESWGGMTGSAFMEIHRVQRLERY